MLVVHVSLTPLAGSPLRIVRALNAHTAVEARLVDLAPDAYGRRTFPEDLVWGAHAAEARALIGRADLLHFHHWFDFDSERNRFGLDFARAARPDALRLVHWHSSPEYVARGAGAREEEVLATALPQLVVAQYHEPYYPRALPVPLVVDTASEPTPPSAAGRPPTVFFAPTSARSAHAERWETKGRPEVLRTLREFERRGLARLDLGEDLPFEECQARMRAADVVIDDVVTGSFHTTSLEAMALGKVAVAFVDGRCRMVLAELTGSTDLPIVDARLEHLEAVLAELCADRALLAEVGRFGADWMRARHSERWAAERYAAAYELLARTGALDNPRYAEHARAKRWLYRDVPDLARAAGRKRLYPGAVGDAARAALRGLRDRVGSRDGDEEASEV